MIVESMAVEGIYLISLALSSTERWQAARSSFNAGSKAEGLLTALAVVALIISEILLFYIFSKNKRSEAQLNQRITDLTITNVELRQEKDKSNLTIEKLKKEVEELTSNIAKLREESAQPTHSV
jgi:signal transduction histidine kinase